MISTMKIPGTKTDENDEYLEVHSGRVMGVSPKICIGVLVVIIIIFFSIAFFFGTRDSESTEVRLISDGSWEGTLTDSSGTRNVSGEGNFQWDIQGDSIDLDVELMEGDFLEVRIFRNGIVVDQGSVEAAGGIVKVSWERK